MMKSIRTLLKKTMLNPRTMSSEKSVASQQSISQLRPQMEKHPSIECRCVSTACLSASRLKECKREILSSMRSQPIVVVSCKVSVWPSMVTTNASLATRWVSLANEPSRKDNMASLRDSRSWRCPLIKRHLWLSLMRDGISKWRMITGRRLHKCQWQTIQWREDHKLTNLLVVAFPNHSRKRK